MSGHLLRLLSEMLPNAHIDLVSDRSWHSLLFSGRQLTLSAELSVKEYYNIADKFTHELSEQNFDLHGLLLADIAVTNQIEEENHIQLTIDALILED